MSELLAGFARVDAFFVENVKGHDLRDSHAWKMTPEVLVGTFIGRGGVIAPKSFQRNSMSLSRFQHALLRARSSGDRSAEKLLGELWQWWSGNVKGRIWVPDDPGLFRLAEPPRKPAPYPQPADSTAGDWVDAAQQHKWWNAERRAPGGGHRERKQATQWGRLRDAAAPVAQDELRRALDLVDEHENPAAKVAAGATLQRRASLWV